MFQFTYQYTSPIQILISYSSGCRDCVDCKCAYRRCSDRFRCSSPRMERSSVRMDRRAISPLRLLLCHVLHVHSPGRLLPIPWSCQRRNQPCVHWCSSIVFR